MARFSHIISLSLFHYSFRPTCSSLSLFFVAFISHLVFLLSLALIIAIFIDICLNYIYSLYAINSSHYNTPCIIPLSFIYYFIIFTLVISIFYCLNYTLLLLHLIIRHLVNTAYNNYVINIYPWQL